MREFGAYPIVSTGWMMSQYDFDYHVRSLRDSFEGIEPRKGMK